MRISTRDQVLTEQASNLHVVLPGNLFANLGGPFTRRAEVSGFLSLNSFLTPYPYTARIHPGHTVFLPTPLTVFYIYGPHTLPDNQPVQKPSFLGMGRTGPTPLPYKGRLCNKHKGEMQNGRGPKTSSGGVGTMSTWGLVGLRSSLAL